MSILIHEFAVVTSALPGNHTVGKFHYVGATQQIPTLMVKSTPKAVNAHQSAVETKQAPMNVSSTASSIDSATMTTSVPFNPTLFFLGLFLLAISIAMVVYIMKRAKQNKLDLNKLV